MLQNVLCKFPYLQLWTNMNRHNNKTILFVDDVKSIRTLVKFFLSQYGYTVLTAATGDEALALYRTKKSEIELIILDLIMPGISGKKCFAELLNINPKAKVVIATGDTEALASHLFRTSNIRAIFQKPFEIDELAETVRRVIEDN